MKAKIIKTEQEYNEACARIYSLMHSSVPPIKPYSIEGEELEILSLLVDRYEHEFHPTVPPDPIEAIKFRIEQMNLKQTDIGLLFGGKIRASEVLNGKRPIPLKMISMLHKYLRIPLESLNSGDTEI